MSIDFATLALAKQYAKQVASAGASEEQIAKLIEEYLAKNPIGQSDWDELNENSSAFVKNKPFYENKENLILIPETSVDFVNMMATIPVDFDFIEGKTYKVIWDGNTYECVAYTIVIDEVSGHSVVFIGNSALAGLPIEGGGSEPFICGIVGGALDIMTETDGKHTFSLSLEDIVIHHLDPKFIKDMYYTEEGKDQAELLVDNLSLEDYENNPHPECNFIVGDYYQVIWNGTTYNTICQMEEEVYRALISVDGITLPFGIDDDGGNGLYIWSEETNWTVSIYHGFSGEFIHKIDPKYLPISTPDWNQINPNSTDFIKNKPFGLKETLFDGEVIFDDNGRFPWDVEIILDEESTLVVSINEKTFYPEFNPFFGSFVIANSYGDILLVLYRDHIEAYKDSFEFGTSYYFSIKTVKLIDSQFIRLDPSSIGAVSFSSIQELDLNSQCQAKENLGLFEAINLTQAQYNLPAPRLDRYLDGAYGNEIFVLIGSLDSGYVIDYTTDKISWTRSNSEILDNLYSITYGDGKFVGIGRNYSIISTNGADWSKALTFPYDNTSRVIYGDGKFVAFKTGTSDNIAYSIDGISWVEAPLPMSVKLSDMAYADGWFIAVDTLQDTNTKNRIIKSSDAINWTVCDIQNYDTVTSQPYKVAFCAGRWVCMSTDLKSAFISDNAGLTWKVVSTTFSSSANYNLISFGNQFIITVKNSSLVSSDGENWVKSKGDTYTNSGWLIAGSGIIMSSGWTQFSYMEIRYSRDGLNWDNGITCLYNSSTRKNITPEVAEVLITEIEENINQLIDSKLGVIENGTY